MNTKDENDLGIDDISEYLMGKKSIDEIGGTNDEKEVEELDTYEELLKKIEALEGNMRAMRNAIKELKNEKTPVSVSELENMIEKNTTKITTIWEEKFNTLEERINNADTPISKEPEKKDDENLYEELEPIADDTLYEEIEEIEEIEEQHRDEVTKQDINTKDKTEKKKTSIIKKMFYFMLFGLLVLGGMIGYLKMKKNNTPKEPIVQLDPLNSSISTVVKNKEKPLSMIDPLKVEAVQKKETTKEETKKNIKKITQKRKIKTAMEIDPFADTKQETIEPERSPIEDELLQNHKKQEDIAFRCRLKAKYPAGDYIFYIKKGDAFIVNPKENTVLISERNVLFNFSPDSTFVKVGKKQYLKTKLFTNCKAIISSN